MLSFHYLNNSCFLTIFNKFNINQVNIIVMEKYKIKSHEDNHGFVITDAYFKLYQAFQSLKTDKGRFIHVIGTPGTGKSTNIYHALTDLDLNVYDAVLFLDNVKKSSKEVFKEAFNTMKKDTGAKTKEEVYEKVSNYDAVLFADKFLDSEFLDPNKVGLSKWMDYKGIKSLPFYFLCYFEYLKHRKELKQTNIILQHSWMIKINGTKYDILTEFGLLSKIIVAILNLSFEVIKISYSKSETIKIVKNHIKDVDEEQIKLCIQKYGYRPRLILENLKN